MTLRDLEDALDRLENELCGKPLPPSVLREIQLFIQAALASAKPDDCWRSNFYRFVRPSVN